MNCQVRWWFPGWSRSVVLGQSLRVPVRRLIALLLEHDGTFNLFPAERESLKSRRPSECDLNDVSVAGAPWMVWIRWGKVAEPRESTSGGGTGDKPQKKTKKNKKKKMGAAARCGTSKSVTRVYDSDPLDSSPSIWSTDDVNIGKLVL